MRNLDLKKYPSRIYIYTFYINNILIRIVLNYQIEKLNIPLNAQTEKLGK